jgi:biotin carboxylase
LLPPEVGETVLFVAAGRSQRAAIARVRELGYRVVAVDGDPGAVGSAEADVVAVADFRDVEAVLEVARSHRLAGVLTVCSDRAVPAVARVAAELGLPGIGLKVAHRMTHKLAMREALARAGVPQPLFAAARTAAEAEAALGEIGVPAVVKPVDSGGQRGLRLVSSKAEIADAFADAMAVSVGGQVIVERFHKGRELNGILAVRGGKAALVTLSDRLRPEGRGFGVGWIHLYPSSLPPAYLIEAGRVAADAVAALGLFDGIAFPQLLVGEQGEVVVVEVAARIPAGQMADLVWHGTGVDLVEVALRQAVARPVPDELVAPRFERPVAVRFLTASPGPLKPGRVTAIRGLDRVRGAAGVVQADLYFEPGEVIEPLRVDNDRRGYVIALGETASQALAYAEAATKLLQVEVEPERANGRP